MNCNLFCHLSYISLHVMRLFAAHRSDFDTLNVPHSGCKTYISSSVVVEMPVSSAWCLNVIQISFYSEEDKRGVLGNYIASVLFVHKAFWKLTFDHFCSPVAVFEHVESGLDEFHLQRSNQWLRTFFRDELCFPNHQWGLLSDCGMKVNVRI